MHNIPANSNTKLATVTVVMSVYDQAEHIMQTVDSVLNQTDVEFELIIIDDGANISVKKALKQFLSEPRISIVEQQNQGLTNSLITGCQLARHDFIARIDAGDIMMKNRLSLQAEALVTHKKIALVCSWVRVTTEEGYYLYDHRPQQANLQTAAVSQLANELSCPFHSSVMFRKSSYQKAGGYRPEFYFSQDCDLWARMARESDFMVIPQVLTTGIFSHNGISGRYAQAQKKLTSLIAQSNRLRDAGQSDKPILQQAEQIRPDKLDAQVPSMQSNYSSYYFVAACLSRHKSKHAKEYWRRAIDTKPYNPVSWFRLFISLFY